MDLSYPIGKFSYVPGHRAEHIKTIASLPSQLAAAVVGMTPEQLETPYRPGGWTVRQTVHHVADSHMNAFIRFRLALTETEPTIKPYEQSAWGELADSRTAPVELSLNLLAALHERWTLLLRSMADADFERTFRHPEIGLLTLEKNTALYAWHSRHHLAHITGLVERMGWGS